MSYFITISSNGQITDVYDDIITDITIPDGAISITQDDLDKFNANIEGHRAFAYVNGKVISINNIVDVKLNSAKESGLSTIDDMAGFTRSLFLTTNPGQSEIYISKYNDAIAYRAAGYPDDLAQFPFIQAELNARIESNSVISAREVADLIIEVRTSWARIGSTIKYIRIKSKELIKNAKTEDQITTILKTASLELKELTKNQ